MTQTTIFFFGYATDHFKVVFGYADSIMPNRQCNKCEPIDKMLTGTKLFPVQRNGIKIFHLNNDSLCHRF